MGRLLVRLERSPVMAKQALAVKREAGTSILSSCCRAGGRPEAARRAGLEVVEKLLQIFAVVGGL
jgi:ABC-type glucose/galactose transport system permease subunit